MALRRSFAEGIQPYVIVQHADPGYDPGDYIQILRAIDGKDDVVFVPDSSRLALTECTSTGMRSSTAFSRPFRTGFTNLNITDMEDFRREVLRSFELEEDRFGIEPEMRAKVERVYEVRLSYSAPTYAEGKEIGWRDDVR